MIRKTKRKLPDPAQVDEVEKQIREYSRTVKFTVVEYSFEFIVQKFNAGRYYVPAYRLTVVSERPRRWTDSILKEWVRAKIWADEERLGDGAVKRLAEIGGTLASGDSPPPFVVKGEPGSWNDESIKKVAERLGCVLKLSREVERVAYERVYRNETTALTYLAHRRNAIAHGSSTFEDGANDITLDELTALGERVLPYLRAVAECYREFLANRGFLAPEVPAT